MDSDGQHRLDDIRKCADEMLEHPEALILGSRDFSGQDVPARSKFGNVMTRNVFRLLCGVKITDIQTEMCIRDRYPSFDNEKDAVCSAFLPPYWSSAS